MKHLIRCWPGLIFILLLQTGVSGQTRNIAISGNAFRIPELSVILTEDEEVVSVRFAMPSDSRIKPYRNIDIKRGDVILYLNGKRIKAVDAFREQYEGLKTGDAVQIGIRRGDDRFIASFDKADPDDLPQMEMAGAHSGEGGSRTMRMSLGPEAEGATPVLGLGALLNDVDGKPQVVAKLPTPGDSDEFPDLQAEDVISKLNGQAIETVDQLVKAFDEIEGGEEVSLEYLRDGKAMKVKFPKTDIQGNIMIRTQ